MRADRNGSRHRHRTRKFKPVSGKPQRSNRMPEYPDRRATAAERHVRTPLRVGYDLRRMLRRHLMVNMMAMMNMMPHVVVNMTMARFGGR